MSFIIFIIILFLVFKKTDTGTTDETEINSQPMTDFEREQEWRWYQNYKREHPWF